jgi:putative nucleotidyltransferase with HDIG domain
MMSRPPVTREEVIRQSRLMPSFPAVVNEILATLDDPDANFNTLVRCISHDPVIAARVLSVANMVATRGRRDVEVNNIFTASSLIGMAKVRSITLISSLGGFLRQAGTPRLPTHFWEHSVAISVCAEELANHVATPISADAALIAGLLHDVGQLWLHALDAKASGDCWSRAKSSQQGIEVLERETFGVDHAVIGGWLAEHWKLSPMIVDAIQHHHNPDAAPEQPLVALVHVAEVLGNALDLGHRERNRVTYLSSAACEQLELVWDDAVRPLFGRIEARSSHANRFFSPGASAEKN